MPDRLQAVLARVRLPSWDRVLVPVFLGAFVVARSGQFEERDPYWQVRAGMENLAGWPLARPDSWSWAGIDGPWYQSSPLWNTILGAGYAAAGFWGIFLLTVAVMGGWFACAYLLALRLGGRRLPGLVGLMASVAPALAMLSPRGTLLVQLLILGSVLVAVEWTRRFARLGARWLQALAGFAVAAGLSVLGNWLHMSFLALAPALAVVWAVVWWFADLPLGRRVAVIGAQGAGWLLGPLLSPYGLVLGWQRTQAVREICEGLILEWVTPFQATIAWNFWLMGIMAGLIGVGVAVWLVWRVRTRGMDPDTGALLALAVIGLPATVAGMTAIRFLGTALLTLAPVVAVLFTDLVDLARRRWPAPPGTRQREYGSGGFWRVNLSIAVILLLPGAAYLGAQHSVPPELRAVASLPQGCQVFSSGALAAPVILTRPDAKVWIDGRADFYGRQHLLDAYGYYWLTMPTLVPPGTGCVLLDAQSVDSIDLVAALDASPDWTPGFADGRYRTWLPARS